MKLRSLGAGVAVCALASFVAPAAGAAPADQNVHATLIRVEAFDAAKNGKGGPAAATPNCTTDDPSAGDTLSPGTGWTVAGPSGARVNVSTVPGPLQASVVPTLQAAFDAWTVGTGAPTFTVASGSTVTRQTANRQTDLLFGRVSGGSIAVTYTWRWSDGLIESDTVFNKALAWADLGDEGDGCYEDGPAVYDLENIAVHEFGHIYGLGHPSGGRFESMYRYGYTGETLKRSPAPGDLTSLAVLY